MGTDERGSDAGGGGRLLLCEDLLTQKGNERIVAQSARRMKRGEKRNFICGPLSLFLSALSVHLFLAPPTDDL